MKTNYFYRISVYLFFFIGLCCSCSNEEETLNTPDSDPTPYKLVYHISPQRDDLHASDQEMMRSLLLIVVKPDGTIENWEEVSLASFEQEYVVELISSQGRKRVYGFANLTDAMKSQIGIASLGVGSTLPDLSAATLLLDNGFQVDESSGLYLPMSNAVDIQVANFSGQRFYMELIRLYSKVRLSFTNESGHDLQLNRIVFTPVTTSPVYVLPQDGQVPVFPSGRTQGDCTYTYPVPPVYANEDEWEYTTYVNESQLTTTGNFQIRITTQTGSQVTTEERFALTDLTAFKRNDFLDIPVILTDYKLEMEVRAYPPIGGYPAEIIEETDGYHLTLNGGGAFVIIPRLIQLSNRTEVTMTDSDWTFTYEDTTPSFFDELPVLENGEIAGILKQTAAGSVSCQLTAEITTSAGISRLISYTLYIHH